MATQSETARNGNQASKKTAGKSGQAKVAPATSATARGSEGTRDEVYGVVSVLYHALQGAQTYGSYIEDAREAGDDELVEFFEGCRSEENERATRAKALLAQRLDDVEGDEGDDESDDDDADDDDDDDDEESV